MVLHAASGEAFSSFFFFFFPVYGLAFLWRSEFCFVLGVHVSLFWR